MCDIACTTCKLVKYACFAAPSQTCWVRSQRVEAQEIRMLAEKDYLEVTVCEPVFVF